MIEFHHYYLVVPCASTLLAKGFIYNGTFFSFQIPPLEYFELRYLIGMFTLFGASLNLYNMFLVIISGGGGKNGSTVAVSEQIKLWWGWVMFLRQ